MTHRWIGWTASLASALALLGPGAALAQVGVGLGSNAARTVPNPAAANPAAPDANPAGPRAPGESATSAPAVGANTSRISRPSQPLQSGQAPDPLPVDPRDTRPPTSLMGMSPATGGAPLATTSVDFGSVLNTGSRIQRDNASKICPTGLVNRNNFCVPPATSAVTR